MSETTWTEQDHLCCGLEAIAKIQSLAAVGKIVPRSCFHFTPLEISDAEPWSDEASFCQRAKPLIDDLPFKLDVEYVGGTSGIEAYDFEMPTEAWLRSRLPLMLRIADEAEMRFEGWSFEPSKPEDFSYLSCGPTLEVFNSKSPEGIAAIEQLKRDAAAANENA